MGKENFVSSQDGKYFIREMIRIAGAPGAGWVNYKWPNPINNKIEDKASYVEKMGDYFVGVCPLKRRAVSALR